MYKKAVKITWKSFTPKRSESSVTFNAEKLFEGKSDYDICNQVFQDTNLYGGFIWDKIKDNLPLERTHTALSIGDEVTIYDYSVDRITKVYRCAEVGWDLESYDIELKKPVKLVGGSK